MDENPQIQDLKLEIERLKQLVVGYETRLNNIEQLLHQSENLRNKTTAHSSVKSLFHNIPLKEQVNFENFIGLRLIHLVGIVVLVIGISIGVKYAIDKELISEVTRILSAYAAGFFLYFLSWRSKEKYNLFSAILFSGAMASLYFTTYAAFVYYEMFSFPVAFILMVVLILFTVYNALEYKRQEIAILGLVGAYTIPFLISQNAERVDLFFAYITLINMGVIFLSFKRSWHLVGQLAQAITWMLFIAWISTRYGPQHQSLAVLFLIIFYLMFNVNALSVKIFRSESFTLKQVQQLLLNNVALYISAIFIFAPEFSDSKITIVTGVATVFIGLKTFLYHKLFQRENYLTNIHVTLTVLLLLIFIAFKWEGIIVTLLWLMTAVILFSCGVYLKSVRLRMSSILLMAVTLLKMLLFDSRNFATIQKIIAYITLGALLLTVSFFYQKFKEQLFDTPQPPEGGELQ